MTVADPTLRVEHALHRDGVEFVIGATRWVAARSQARSPWGSR